MRLDQWLIEKGYFETRERARQEILAGKVRREKSGEVLDKPGMKVPKDLQVFLIAPNPFVSRAGEKLEFFLQAHSFHFEGKKVLDVGSSTGGFTDCVLKRGADKVWAVDVGTNQLHERIRQNEKVSVFEETDIRELDFHAHQIKPDFVLIDVSFISVFHFLERLKKSFPSSYFFILFKPQFEIGREVNKPKGIVAERDRELGLKAFLERLKKLGFYAEFVEDSAVRGAKGNQETIVAGSFQIPRHIFRTYDIRGHADRDLPNELFARLGYVLGRRIIKQSAKDRPVVGLGRDARESSPRLFAALIQGLSQHQKLRLVDLGLTATPMVYFANHQMELDAAFQVTASHNTKEDNGMKMMVAQSTLFGDEIATLYDEIQELDFEITEASNEVEVEDRSGQLVKDYLNFLHSQFQFSKKFKILVDSANGMAGLVIRRALEPYASDLEVMFEEVDCRFPNHPADPTVEANLLPLQKRLSEVGADIGFSFDGDGDRLGVISRSGRIFWGDEILMLLSEKVLKEKPGAAIIGEVKCSEKLFKMIESRGGKPVMYRTGHSLIKKHMKEIGAPIAGEMSGHLFFSDRYFGFDDAIYASFRVLEVISDLELDLDQWISAFPKSLITPEIRVSCKESEKTALVDRMISFFKSQKDAKLSLIDGVRASFSDGSWVLVRASNTEAVLVVRIEALSEGRMSELKQMVDRAFDRGESCFL